VKWPGLLVTGVTTGGTIRKKKKKAPKPPATLNGANWISSEAKEIMAQDIIDGHIEPDPKVAVDVHEMYKKLYAHRAEFKDFPFIEERYKDRLDKL
jgi:hypothetical protein